LERKWLLNNQEKHQASALKRNIAQDTAQTDFAKLSKLDIQLREIITKQETTRAEQNQIKGFNDQARALKDALVELTNERNNIESKVHEFLINQPNILLDEVPAGKSEADNVVIFETTKSNKITTPHYDLIDDLVMKDEAAHISGSRFVILKSALSMLKHALTSFMLEMNRNQGYEEYTVPYVVNESALFGTGQLPKFAEDAYQLTQGQWLISTGEIALVNMFGNRFFNEHELPKLCMTFSPCYRSEAGSASRDTKGLIRLHQFHKLELVTICTKENANAMHEKKLNAAKKILDALELPYRILLLCGADTGFTAAKQYDIELWLPGMQRYLEIASCSQCGTFQAVRANIKYKTSDGKNEYAHTLNGSALPIERLLVGIIEKYSTTDGIMIPKVLEAYMNGTKMIKFDNTII